LGYREVSRTSAACSQKVASRGNCPFINSTFNIKTIRTTNLNPHQNSSNLTKVTLMIVTLVMIVSAHHGCYKTCATVKQRGETTLRIRTTTNNKNQDCNLLRYNPGLLEPNALKVLPIFLETVEGSKQDVNISPFTTPVSNRKRSRPYTPESGRATPNIQRYIHPTGTPNPDVASLQQDEGDTNNYDRDIQKDDDDSTNNDDNHVQTDDSPLSPVAASSGGNAFRSAFPNRIGLPDEAVAAHRNDSKKKSK
jgi:hypothetical protein